jgi:hypothetical protein
MSKITWDYNDRDVLFKDGNEWVVALPAEIIHEITRLSAEVERLRGLVEDAYREGWEDGRVEDVMKPPGWETCDAYKALKGAHQ